MAVSSNGWRVSVPAVLLALLLLLLVLAGPSSASGPDGRLQGFVTDSGSGAPIEGASVRIEASDFPWVFGASTDTSGYFQLAVPPHRYTMTVSGPAYLVNTTAIAVGSGQTVWANTTLDAASSRSARLQGYVTDGVSGAPVTVGRIVARPWAGSFPDYENASSLNASGYYGMDLAPSSYEIATDGIVGYVPYSDLPVYLGAGGVLWYNLSLTPNPVDGWINGTVYDAITSDPIAGARVTARVDGLLLLAPVGSNATGAYALPVPSGSVEIAADALGYAPASTTVYAGSGGRYTQNLYLTPLSRTVRGYLKDGVTGAYLPGVLVTVAPIFFDGYYDQGTTNASGGYQLAVPEDYYVVSARPAGYAPWSTWIINFPGATAWANGTLWPIVSRVSGYVRDAVDGSPVPGLVVSAIDLRTSYQIMMTSDAFGFYTLDVPPSPAMSVWVYGQPPYAGNVSYVETRPYATTWANLTVDRLSAQLVANVTDALTGLPIPGASVIAAWFYGNGFGTTDANGSTTLDVPGSVDVYVTAVASGYDYWIGLITPVAGTNSLSIALWPDLPSDVRILGYVRDSSSGVGMSSVSVEATGYDGFTATAYTNSTGYYELYTVAAPQILQAWERDYAGSRVSVDPAPGEILWVNLTLTADANAPSVRSFTATPSTGLSPANPAALLADINETTLDRADLSIHRLHSSLAGVGTFLNLGYFNPADVSIGNPSNGTWAVASSWDTRTRVARLSDAFGSTWWPVVTVSPFLAVVTGYYDDATLSTPILGNAVFDTRDGRFLFAITGTEFIGPMDDLTSTFAPYASGTRINLATAGILGYTFVSGPAFLLSSLRLALASSVPSGTYAAVLDLRDAAGHYTRAAVIMQTVADSTPPVANAGPDRTVDEDGPVTLNGMGSTDNVGITNYTWTFVDGSPRTLYGALPTYVFATPGTYVVILTVRDADGNVAMDTVTVTVRDVTDPTIFVVAPAEGFQVSGSMTVRANVSDNVAVVRVELRVDGTSVGNDTADPFEFLLSAGTLAVGNHTLEVIAFDAAGNSASEVRHVTVVAGGNPLLSNTALLSGLVLLALAGIAGIALLILRRRRRRIAAAPPTPASSEAPSEMAQVDAFLLDASAHEPTDASVPEEDLAELPPR